MDKASPHEATQQCFSAADWLGERNDMAVITAWMITSNGQCHLELINVKRTEVVFIASPPQSSTKDESRRQYIRPRQCGVLMVCVKTITGCHK